MNERNQFEIASEELYAKLDYIIFPLCCLSINLTFKKLIKYLISYSAVEIAEKRYKSYNRKFRDYIISTGAYDSKKYPLNKIILWVHHKIRKKYIKNLRLIQRRYNLVKRHIERFENNHGKDANVLIGVELMRDVLNKSALTERQFRILCATYSKIGQSTYQIIYNKEINLRSLGYRNEKILMKEKQKSYKNIKFYSKKVLAIEITFLKKGYNGRNFFDRVRDGRRYYYSRTLRGEELENLVLERKLNNANVRIIEENSRNRKVQTRYKKILEDIRCNKIDINELGKLHKLKKRPVIPKKKADRNLNPNENL